MLKSINKIAKINNQDELLPEDLEFIRQDQEVTAGYSLLDLFRYRSLRMIAIVTGLVDMIVEFIYDGTILSLDKIGINVYLDQILVGLVEIGAAFFCAYMVVKVRRKRFTSISFALVAVFAVLIGILALIFEHKDNEINAHTIAEMFLLGFLRFVMNSLWGVLFVYIAELYPSDVTSLSMGWVSAMGTVGAVTAPYIRLLTADATYFFMGGLCVGAILLINRLKETKGEQSRQGIE